MIFEGDVTPQQILEQVGGYQAFLPAEATIEHDGKMVALKDLPDIQNAKDLSTLAKNYVESQREIGRRIRMPGKDAAPEEIAALKTKLTEAGILTAPLASPADYGIVKPETLPEGQTWSDELATELATTLHKHGAAKGLAGDLLALYNKALTGTQQTLNTSYEAGIAALKAEYGDKYDERVEVAKRLSSQIFTSPEEIALFDAAGWGNHPGFLSVLMRLAPLAQQDSTFIKGLQSAGGEITGESARAELAKIMSDPQHPMYALYKKGDSKALAFVDEVYKKAYGTKQVEIT